MKASIIALLGALTLAHASPVQAQEVPSQAAPIILGAEVPRVLVTFFIDYQCPNCRRSHDTLSRVLQRHGESAQIQLRFLPMDGHHLAISAVMAAYAAQRQDRFLPMHVALTRTRNTWEKLDEAGFKRLLLEQLIPWTGLNREQFEADWADPTLRQMVLSEREAVRDLEVTAVPTVWVNGVEAELYLRPDSQSHKLLSARLRDELRLAPEKSCQESGDCGVQERIRTLLELEHSQAEPSR